MRDNTYSGQVLYHYTDLRGLIGILKSRCIRATDIQNLFGWTIPLADILILQNRLFASEREWRVMSTTAP